MFAYAPSDTKQGADNGSKPVVKPLMIGVMKSGISALVKRAIASQGTQRKAKSEGRCWHVWRESGERAGGAACVHTLQR